MSDNDWWQPQVQSAKSFLPIYEAEPRHDWVLMAVVIILAFVAGAAWAIWFFVP